MNSTRESNTQAILLLTSPLLGNSRSAKNGADLLSLGEYNELARALHDRKRTPSDLLGEDAPTLLDECRGKIDRTRLEQLLARGLALAHAWEHWQARGIWVVSRADSHYPRRLRTRLKEGAPPVLYGCGKIELCEAGGLAIVGSRDATEEQLCYAANVAALVAKFGHSVVSGGARGVDQASMNSALEAGGNVVGMLADGLMRTAIDRRNRDPLRAGRLVLLSICDPSAGFHTGIAMQRNRLIYALADAGLVVNAEFGKGGTWTGAVEQLDKLRLVPIYLRDRGELGKGMTALRERGAMSWPHPQTAREFDQALAAKPVPPRTQSQLPFHAEPLAKEVRERPTEPEAEGTWDGGQRVSPASRLLALVREMLMHVGTPKTETEIADYLGVSKVQAKAWLSTLVGEGVLQKTKRPVRYRVATGSGIVV